MMRIKSGVRLHGIRPEILVALITAQSVYNEWRHGMRITSGIEGKHRRSSAHYSGRAVDLGVQGIAENQANAIAMEIQHRLGEDYDVLYEKKEAPHIHMEWDPKGKYA